MFNCQNKFGSNNNGKLFEPKDSSTNDQIINTARDMKSTVEIWIGINDIATEGTWKYTTGGNLVNTNWASGQPDDHHGYLIVNVLINFLTLSLALYYVTFQCGLKSAILEKLTNCQNGMFEPMHEI